MGATPPTPDTVTTMARGPLMLRPSPRLMLRLTTLVDMDSPATLMDTVPTATATPPTPDTATTTARGPLMLRPSPRLMLRLTSTVDTPPTLMATVPTAMALMAMATHTPMAVTTTKLLLDLYP